MHLRISDADLQGVSLSSEDARGSAQKGFRFRVWGLGFRVEGLGVRFRGEGLG